MGQQSKFDDALDTPPGSPAVGDSYLVVGTATGVWSGKEGQIAKARTTSGGWMYTVPKVGDRWYNEADAIECVFDGTRWIGIVGPWSAWTGWSSNATAAGAEYTSYEASTTINYSKFPSAGYSVLITSRDINFRTGGSAGTYTLTCIVDSSAGGNVNVGTAIVTTAVSTITKLSEYGSIFAPLAELVGDDHADDYQKIGFVNEATSPAALTSHTGFLRYDGVIVKVYTL